MIQKILVILSSLIFLSSCADPKEEATQRTSPRIKKFSKIESPTQNQTIVRGDLINVSITSSAGEIDSIEINIDDIATVFTSSTFEIALPGQQVGTRSLRAKVFLDGKTETHYRNVIVLPENDPREMTYSVNSTIFHDKEDYTQGLLIHEGVLYESTGQRGKSALKRKNLLNGETESSINLSSDLFGEGLALLNGRFYQLTWTSGKAIIYDLNLKQVGMLAYQTEGWGLVSYKDQLIMTDGSEKLYFIDASSFATTKVLEAYSNSGKQEALNELEIVDGLLYANVYQEDYVVVIDPETGEILNKIDFSGLLTQEEANDSDVLNGIAYDKDTKKLYVTGKWWPKLFEVTIEPKTIQ